MFSQSKLEGIVQNARVIGADAQNVEIKASVGKLPKSMSETLSAFANGSGGIVILGLSERNGFLPAQGFNPRPIADALAAMCADSMTPPVRAEIEIMPFEDTQVVVARVDELTPFNKPCYITGRGMYEGSYIRMGDGDRLLSPYEIDRLVEERAQPKHDHEIVEDATLDDLDKRLVAAVLNRQRELHPRVFASFSDEQALCALGIVRADKDGHLRPTLAGLLALGFFPQQFFPRLTVTFAAFLGVNKASVSGVKFVDSMSMAGPIPAVIEDTVAAVRRNSRTGGKLVGIERVDVPDYPDDVVRELVCNTLMHRDYSPYGRGSQVQVNLYADRLEVLSPGGLFGAVTVDTIGEIGASSTRNQHLAALLETTPYRHGYVAENRGTGFQLIERELAQVGMDLPEITDRPSLFTVVIRKNRALERADVDSENQGSQARLKVRFLPNDPEPHSQSSKGAGKKEQIVAYVLENPNSRASDIARDTGLVRSTVNFWLRKLLEGNVIEVAEGSVTNPHRTYRISGDVSR